MFGPALDTYKPNKVALAVLFGISVAIVVSIVAAGGQLNTAMFVWTLVFCSPFLLPAGWMLTVKLSLHQEGLIHQSMFGTTEMRWDEVEKFYYSSVKRSINLIPVGTYYTFKLIDRNGNKLSFGNRFERREELGQKLIENTYQPLYQRLADLYNSGVELDFGAIRMQREHGLKIKKTFRWKKMPWDQLGEYAINEGIFYLWPVGKKYVTGPSLGDVANAFVLIGLLDELSGRNNEPQQEPQTGEPIK